MPRYASAPVQQFKGSHRALQSYVGANGEVFFDETQGRLVMMDGVTPGGIPHARLDELTDTLKTYSAGSGITIDENNVISEKVFYDVPLYVGDAVTDEEAADILLPPDVKFAEIVASDGSLSSVSMSGKSSGSSFEFVSGTIYDVSSEAGKVVEFLVTSTDWAGVLVRFYAYDPS